MQSQSRQPFAHSQLCHSQQLTATFRQALTLPVCTLVLSYNMITHHLTSHSITSCLMCALHPVANQQQSSSMKGWPACRMQMALHAHVSPTKPISHICRQCEKAAQEPLMLWTCSAPSTSSPAPSWLPWLQKQRFLLRYLRLGVSLLQLSCNLALQCFWCNLTYE